LPSMGDGYEEGGAAERCRPDCGMVVGIGEVPKGYTNKVGKPRDLAEEFRHAHKATKVREFVMVRPYAGVRFSIWVEPMDEGVTSFINERHVECSLEMVPGWERSDLLILGHDPVRGDAWSDDLVMALRWVKGNPPSLQWRPVTNWVLMEMDNLAEGKAVLSSVHLFNGCGLVCDAGPEATCEIGTRWATANDMHLQSPDDPKWLRTKWTTLEERHLLVRERDADGVRRLLAQIEA
jgi:hypothetical protein